MKMGFIVGLGGEQEYKIGKAGVNSNGLLAIQRTTERWQDKTTKPLQVVQNKYCKDSISARQGVAVSYIPKALPA